MTPELIHLQRIADPRGNLDVAEHPGALSASVTAVRWHMLYRNESALKLESGECERLALVLSGKAICEQCDVTLGSDATALRLLPYREYTFRTLTAHALLVVIHIGTEPDPGQDAIASATHRATCRDAVEMDVHSHVADRGHLPGARRAFFISGMHQGALRGGHAHYRMSEMIVALSGSFNVTVDDGLRKHVHTLCADGRALLVPPGLWRELSHFAKGSVCLALADTNYDETDYIRSYTQYLQLK